MRKRAVKRNSKIVFIRSLLIFCIISASVFSGYSYAVGKRSGIINKNVYIQNIDISGKSAYESTKLIKEKLGQPLSLKKIDIEASNKTYILDCSKLEAQYKIDEAIQEALNYSAEGSTLEIYKSKLLKQRKDIKLNLDYKTKPIDEIINKIEKECNTSPVNSKIFIINGEVKIIPEIDGLKLQKDKLKQDVISEINRNNPEGNSKIYASFDILKPEITNEKLSAINTLISSFSTNFSSSISNRINNIELAVKSINGTVLMPGEVFSFNKTVGERTKERGYQEAGVIIKDKLENGIGGGICQVSSTLYNAVLTANLEVVERRNHSLPLAYIAKGLDATVDWGNIDLKFKNNLNVPVYIEGYTKNKNLYFQVYSNKDLAKASYKLATEVYETIQPKIKYIDDPNLPEGKTQIIKKGTEGYKVKTVKHTFENGKIIKTEHISDNYYIPVDEEVARGIKNRF